VTVSACAWSANTPSAPKSSRRLRPDRMTWTYVENDEVNVKRGSHLARGSLASPGRTEPSTWRGGSRRRRWCPGRGCFQGGCRRGDVARSRDRSQGRDPTRCDSPCRGETAERLTLPHRERGPARRHALRA